MNLPLASRVRRISNSRGATGWQIRHVCPSDSPPFRNSASSNRRAALLLACTSLFLHGYLPSQIVLPDKSAFVTAPAIADETKVIQSAEATPSDERYLRVSLPNILEPLSPITVPSPAESLSNRRLMTPARKPQMAIVVKPIAGVRHFSGSGARARPLTGARRPFEATTVRARETLGLRRSSAAA